MRFIADRAGHRRFCSRSGAAAAAGARRLRAVGAAGARSSIAAASRPTAAGWRTASTARTARTNCEWRTSPTARRRRSPSARSSAFSADSRWAAVSVGLSEAQQDKLRKDKKPVRRKLTLLNLATGEHVHASTASTRSRSAPTASSWLMRRYAPERAPAPARGEPDPALSLDPEEPAGRDRRRPRPCERTRHDVRQRRRCRRGRRKAGCSRSPSPPRIAPATACRSSIPPAARCACSTRRSARYLGPRVAQGRRRSRRC